MLCASLALGVLASFSALGQSEESDAAPARGQFEAEPHPPPEKEFLVPDIPHAIAEQTQVRERWFTLKPGLVLLVDYTEFQQDSDSISQVKQQDDQWDARSVRMMVRGTIGLDYKVKYLVAGEYKGFDTDPDDSWQMTDVSFTFPLFGPATSLTVGKTKESFVYEMVGDAANLPQSERILNPFFTSRNVGLKLSQVFGAEHRATATVGVFNDWWVSNDSFEESGTDVTARFTGLVWDQPDRNRFLHLGLSGRYVGEDSNTARYKARPESNVADNYLDTGNFPADHAWHLGLEALWNEGPFSVLAEYTRAWVASGAAGNPQFAGYYLTASWIITGETRPYDRTVGFARRVMPTKHWGAPEIVARFSHIDLDDNPVQGGSLDKTYLGLNWWATRRWKFGLGWGHTWLDRFGTTGNTDIFLARIQWIY